MTTIYVVTEGQYSSYRIVGFFSTKDKADAFKGKFDTRVEEYELDNLEPGLYLSSYAVWMKRDGTCARVEERGLVTPDAYRLLPGPYLFVQCFAKDEQHAVKIANEKRTQMIALGQWEEGE